MFQRVARHGEQQCNKHIGGEVRLDGKRDGLPAHLERERLEINNHAIGPKEIWYAAI